MRCIGVIAYPPTAPLLTLPLSEVSVRLVLLLLRFAVADVAVAVDASDVEVPLDFWPTGLLVLCADQVLLSNEV